MLATTCRRTISSAWSPDSSPRSRADNAPVYYRIIGRLGVSGVRPREGAKRPLSSRLGRMGFRFRAEGLEIKAGKPYSAWMMSITPASPIDLGRPPAGVRFQGDVVLFGCLFLTLVLAAVALMLLLGHVELTKNGDAG